MTRESTVVIVDDDRGMCDSLSRVLTQRGYGVIACTSAVEYLRRTEIIDADCLLADIRMPEIDGIMLRHTLTQRGQDLPTVFMTGSRDIPTVVEAMKAGAVDLLEKPFETSELIAAVEHCVAKSEETHRQRRLLARIWAGLRRLTPREAEVCGYVASGFLNKQVAVAIGTTEKTVKVHRARVMQKLEAASVADLVRIVEQALLAKDRESITIDGEVIERPRGVPIIGRVLHRD